MKKFLSILISTMILLSVLCIAPVSAVENEPVGGNVILEQNYSEPTTGFTEPVSTEDPTGHCTPDIRTSQQFMMHLAEYSNGIGLGYVSVNDINVFYNDYVRTLVFGFSDNLCTVSEEDIDGYHFENWNFFPNQYNKTGYCVYSNGTIYSIADAVKDNVMSACELASIIPHSYKIDSSTTATQYTEPSTVPTTHTEPTATQEAPVTDESAKQALYTLVKNTYNKLNLTDSDINLSVFQKLSDGLYLVRFTVNGLLYTEEMVEQKIGNYIYTTDRPTAQLFNGIKLIEISDAYKNGIIGEIELNIIANNLSFNFTYNLPTEPVTEPTKPLNCIYFDTDGWNNFNNVYCHIYDSEGNYFFNWQMVAEKCVKYSGTVYMYDLSKLNSSGYVSGGLEPGKIYCIIFSTDMGHRTYPLTFSTECIGDTACLTSAELEDPNDGKTALNESAWKQNGEKYGPHFEINAIGELTGRTLCTGENAVSIIGDWIEAYYFSPNADVVETLKNAYHAFGIKTQDDVDRIVDYVEDSLLSKYTFEQTASELAEIKAKLYEAMYGYAAVDPYNISTWTVQGASSVVYNGKAQKPSLKLYSGTKLMSSKYYTVSYKNNTNVGKATVTIKGKGKYAGTIVCWFKILKAQNPVTVSAKMTVTASSKKSTTINNAVTVKKAQGAVSCKTDNKKVTVKNGKLIVAKGLKKGKTYTVKITVTDKGTKNYSPKTVVKVVKIKVK